MCEPMSSTGPEVPESENHEAMLAAQDCPRQSGDTGTPTFARGYSAVVPKLRMAMFAAAVVSTSLVVGMPAHADNGSDFLAILSGEGINVGDTPADVELTLSSGQLVCHLLHDGYTPQDAERDVRYAFPNATPQQLAGFVEAARAKLCAQAYTPLQPGGW